MKAFVAEFIATFALTFVAIPLETFVHSLRTVIGLIAMGVLRFLSLALRLSGNACRYLGVLLNQLYDLPLFIPLWWAAREPGAVGLDDAGLRELRS